MDRKEGGEEGGESWLFTHEGKMEGGQTQRFQAFFDLLFEEFSGRMKPFFCSCMLNPHHVSGQTFRVMKTASPFFQMRKKEEAAGTRENNMQFVLFFFHLSSLSLSHTHTHT